MMENNYFDMTGLIKREKMGYVLMNEILLINHS